MNRLELLENRVSAGVVMAHVAGVEQVKLAFLAAADNEMGAGNAQNSRSAEIVIDRIHRVIVVGNEPVLDGKCAAGQSHLEKCFTVIGAAAGSA